MCGRKSATVRRLRLKLRLYLPVRAVRAVDRVEFCSSVLVAAHAGRSWMGLEIASASSDDDVNLRFKIEEPATTYLYSFSLQGCH